MSYEMGDMGWTPIRNIDCQGRPFDLHAQVLREVRNVGHSRLLLSINASLAAGPHLATVGRGGLTGDSLLQVNYNLTGGWSRGESSGASSGPRPMTRDPSMVANSPTRTECGSHLRST